MGDYRRRREALTSLNKELLPIGSEDLHRSVERRGWKAHGCPSQDKGASIFPEIGGIR